MRNVIWTDFLSAVKACKQAVRQLLVVKPISNMVNKTKRRAHHLMCVLRDLRQEMRFHGLVGLEDCWDLELHYGVIS